VQLFRVVPARDRRGSLEVLPNLEQGLQGVRAILVRRAPSEYQREPSSSAPGLEDASAMGEIEAEFSAIEGGLHVIVSGQEVCGAVLQDRAPRASGARSGDALPQSGGLGRTEVENGGQQDAIPFVVLIALQERVEDLRDLQEW